jgi:small subunit ribosomal protein S8
MNTDPIADLLTRIRNGLAVGKKRVEIPSSNMKRDILKILTREGFIEKFVIVDDGKQGTIKVKLKYNQGTPVIQGLQRISKPGLRQYAKAGNIPKILNGLGMSIVSTSKGLLTDKEARTENCGGELICKIW